MCSVVLCIYKMSLCVHVCRTRRLCALLWLGPYFVPLASNRWCMHTADRQYSSMLWKRSFARRKELSSSTQKWETKTQTASKSHTNTHTHTLNANKSCTNSNNMYSEGWKERKKLVSSSVRERARSAVWRWRRQNNNINSTNEMYRIYSSLRSCQKKQYAKKKTRKEKQRKERKKNIVCALTRSCTCINMGYLCICTILMSGRFRSDFFLRIYEHGERHSAVCILHIFRLVL